MHRKTPGITEEEALDVYFREFGENADQPAGFDGGFERTEANDGWVLENVRGPLAVVLDTGELGDVRDLDEG